MKYNYLDSTIKDKMALDKVAVICNEKKITYRELNMYSMKMSKIVDAMIKKTNDTVIILLNKSIEAVIAIYGAIFSECAYIPLDYNLPEERLLYIIENSGASVVITDSNAVDRIKKDINIICIDEYNKSAKKCEADVHWDGIYKEYDDNVFFGSHRNRLDDVAYIIYTSGSTGVPKGVMIPQKSIMTFVRDMEKNMHYCEDTVYLNVSPLYFDASVLDLFCILNMGGTLVLLNNFLFPNDILKVMEKYRVTDTLLVSSILKLLASKLAKIEKYDLSSLKTIWYGGEGCPIDVLREIKRKLPNISFIHGYGPTESTHTALWYKFDEIPCEIVGYMPIGKVLPSVYAYVLDENGKQVLPGNKGELYIGGEQLMIGYCNDDAKTREYLIDDPFVLNKIIYRTGDIVSVDDNGLYWYHGRNDDMVKCGGNLVYLSEIEHCLLEHSLIKDAIAMAVADNLYNNKIVVAIVLHLDNKQDNLEQTLRQYIAQRLPSYMIPSIFMFFDENDIPRTQTGKADKKKLSLIINGEGVIK